MTLLPISTAAEQTAFEDECFRSWLNRVDARIDYDNRRKLASVATWREAFERGDCESEAAEMFAALHADNATPNAANWSPALPGFED